MPERENMKIGETCISTTATVGITYLGESSVPCETPVEARIGKDEHQANLQDDVKFLTYAGTFLKKSLPISVMRALPYLQNLVFYFLIGLYNDKNKLEGFGLGWTVATFANIILMSNSTECMGMYAAKSLGAGDFLGMRLAYYRGIGINTMILLLSILLFIRIDLILIAIGFPVDASNIAWTGAMSLIPYLVV
jgi:Na+-driven multidrug efflux pump